MPSRSAWDSAASEAGGIDDQLDVLRFWRSMRSQTYRAVRYGDSKPRCHRAKRLDLCAMSSGLEYYSFTVVRFEYIMFSIRMILELWSVITLAVFS